MHDVGAFSMTSSDSKAMRRLGEVIIRTWQTTNKMEKQRGRLPQEKADNDTAAGARSTDVRCSRPLHTASSVIFVSKAALKADLGKALGIEKAQRYFSF